MNRIAEKKFNTGKPYVISYGNYQLPTRKIEKINNNKIHVVYAGIIESGRKAAELAVKSTLYLDKNFILHILGFGDIEQVKILEKLVTEINKQKGFEAVIFHGKKRGEEFTDFLHTCHIGVSSHAYLPEEIDSANYTFPSKIPTYMSHDLYVVSPDIPCVVDSPFVEFTSFYHKHKPEEIAKAIKKCNQMINNSDRKRVPTKLISEIDNKFQLDIKKVFSN